MSREWRMEELALHEIVSDDELKVRVEIDAETVREYYEAMETEEDVKKFPKIVVYFDGCRYWLADGHHRYWAAKRRGYEKILVKVIDGSHDDAILAAVKLNAQNGLRFNDGDWEKIIPLISKKEQWSDWSNRKLAAELGCGRSTVDRYRPAPAVAPGGATEKRQGKDGKMYKAKKDKKPKVDPPKPETSPDTPPQTPPVAKEPEETEETPSTPCSPKDATGANTGVVTEIVNPPSTLPVDAMEERIMETVDTLERQINEWFDLAPPDRIEPFAERLRRRLRPLVD